MDSRLALNYTTSPSMASISNTLTKNWSFAQLRDGREGESTVVERVPTSVHVELLKVSSSSSGLTISIALLRLTLSTLCSLVVLSQAGKIPDPFKGMAEYDVQWVGEADWVWETRFTCTSDELGRPHHDIVFEGLDTFCKVQLVSISLSFFTSDPAGG